MAYPSTIDTFSPRTDDVDDVMAADINAVYTVVELIETELGTDPAGSAADVKTRLAHSISDGGYLAFDDSTELTIASGAVTVTQNFHRIDTEGDGALDYLDTISGGEAGWWLVLRAVSAARTVEIRHGVGNVLCAGGVNITLDTLNEFVILIYDGNQSAWLASRGVSGEAISGTGASGQVAYFTGAETLDSTADLTFDASTGVAGNASGGTGFDLAWASDNYTKIFAIDVSADSVKFGDVSNDTYAYFDASGKARHAKAHYRRYYHLPLFAANPGATGPTFTACDTNTLGGWQLNAAGELLYFDTDVHSDWDGASNLSVEVKFEVNVDNSGGNAGDTVDLRLQCFYKGNAETSCKTQVVENAVTVGASARYKRFTTTFVIDYDAVDNVVEAGDVISMILNLETDSSEVDDIIIADASMYYPTGHIGIEDGDV